MLNKLLAFIVIIELLFLFIVNPSDNKKVNYKYSVNIYKPSDLDKAKLENYVIGVVAAEMPATFSVESLKAQAVAARTFAYKKIINNKLDYNNLSTDKGQAYITVDEMKKKWGLKFDEYYKKIVNAVISTKNEIILYNDEVINAYYFSISNGKTEDSSYVFGDLNYLVSVESPWDKNYSSYSDSVNMSFNEFKNKLGLIGNIKINNIKRTNTNHVEEIVINNKKYTGVEFRKLLNLKSTDFEIEINDINIKITTKGHGHGVGMSQYGANSMAIEGKNYEDIIKYYYKDVEITKI
ncbi:MAG: stage II sporulation protein D [Bacilli bacterium]|nr:stage II sporulation protein D [Bacilli bacterium]